MKIHMLALFLLLTVPLSAQTADNVLLVLNEASPLSMDVGTYYANKRGIAQSNILRIKTTLEESLPRENFEREIEAPIAQYLVRNFAQDRILYIVLTKGIPIRIQGTSGLDATTASVDSELTLLYRKLLSLTMPLAGPIRNPYFLNDKPVAQAKQFSHASHDIYLVSRLDGYTLADIQGLIDRGFAPSRDGKILLDTKGSLTQKGDSWLAEASAQLGKMGFQDRTVLESSAKVLTGKKTGAGLLLVGIE